MIMPADAAAASETTAYTFRVEFGQNVRILMPLCSSLDPFSQFHWPPSSCHLLRLQSDGSIDYSTARLDRKLPASRASSRIELDGRLDEPAWAIAPVAKDFIQNDPREGEPATFDTEVRMISTTTRCIGVFAKDDQPSNIIVSELRKDFNTGNNDSFIVIIDTFKDERNGYQFAVNPAGAKFDAQMSNEGRENNSNWDGVWDVRTRVGEGR